MFRGISALNLDLKGRVVMPARYRERLQSHGSQLVITIDTESPCLLLYPLPEWEIIERKIALLPSFNPVTRRIQRLLIGHATEVEIDRSGRILLPPLLREYASLEKHLVLVGQGVKFELWDEKQWQACRDIWLTEQAELGKELPNELQSLAL